MNIQYRFIAYAIGFAVVAFLAWRTIVYFENVGYQRATNHYEALIADAAAESLRKERELHNKVDEANKRSAEREKQHRVELAILDSRSRQLRYTIEDYKRRLPGSSVAACVESASTIAELFSRSSEEYQRVAEAADRHANDARTCYEAWPK